MLAFALQQVNTEYPSGITQAQVYLPHVVMFGQWKFWIQITSRLVWKAQMILLVLVFTSNFVITWVIPFACVCACACACVASENQALLSSLLKFCLSVFNYNSPTKCVFYICMALFVIFFNFLQWNLPEFSQHIASCRVRILNTTKVGLVNAVRKNWSDRIPWKMSSN